MAVCEQKEASTEFECMICMQLLYKPMECSACETATFCAPCAKQIGGDNPTCPQCKKQDGFKNLHRKTMNILS